MYRKSRGFKWFPLIGMAILVLLTVTLGPAANSSAAETKPAPAASAAKTVYLTFDDGPSRLTPKVLSILKENNIKATFFVIGQQAQASPELIRQIADGGHTLGNHTYDHEYDKLYHNFSDFWGQIKHTEEILQEITGYRTPFVRAPGGTYGHFDQSYFSLMADAGYKVFDWDIDSGDSARKGVPVSEILKNATDAGGKSSIVLLMHDGSGHDNTVKALPQIIQYYKQHGYQFAPLTRDTRPVQFHVGGNLPKGRQTPSQGWISSHIAPNRALFEDALPLNVTAGGVQTKLAAGEYELTKDAFYVPLRLVLERLGADVVWNAADKSAKVVWNGQSFTIDPATGEMSVQQRIGMLTRSAGTVMIRNDAIWIPLRALFEGLSHPEISVQKTDKSWNVKVF